MTKKKLIITITSLCLVVVAAVAAVVGILAATNVTISSSLKVTYTPDPHVIATVTANYQVENGSVTEIGNHSYRYNQVQSTTDVLDLEEIKLNDTNKYVVFEFKFQNDAVADNQQSRQLHVAVAGGPEATKMTVTTRYSKTAKTLTDIEGIKSISAENTAASVLGNIPYGETGNVGYMYVVVERQEGIAGSWQGANYTFTLTATENAQ